jgi:hypothetical protein
LQAGNAKLGERKKLKRIYSHRIDVEMTFSEITPKEVRVPVSDTLVCL